MLILPDLLIYFDAWICLYSDLKKRLHEAQGTCGVLFWARHLTMPFLVTLVRNNKSLLGKTKTGGEPNGKGKSMERQNTAVVAQSLVVQLKQDPYVFNPRSSRRAAAG